MTYQLTDEEKTFVSRMIPHFAAGMSFEQAARAVLDDDMRLTTALLASDRNPVDQGYALSCPTTVGQEGAIIRQALTHTVYSRLKAA